MLTHEEAVGEGAEEVLEEGGRDEHGALREVDRLLKVQLLSDLPHAAGVWRASEDAHRRRAFLEDLRESVLRKETKCKVKTEENAD